MRAAIAVAAFAVAANAIAIPAGELSVRADLPSQPENGAASDAPALDPNAAPKGTPETHSGKPETHSGEPETHSGKPETHSGKPETHSGKPETHSGKPESESYPPTGNTAPYPPQSDSYPPTGNTGPYVPPASDSYPESGTTGPYVPPKDNDYEYTKPSNYEEPVTYTPTYPSGGYKPPKDYSPDCEYSKPNPPSPPKDCDYGSKEWPYPIDYPAKGNYGQAKNVGNDYAPKGYEHNSDYAVYSPAHGDSVKCGDKHEFKWHGFKGKQVKLELVYGEGGDDCHHYTTISESCDNSGSYHWEVPSDIPPTGGKYGYGLKVTCHETNEVYYSPQFCFENDDFYGKFKHPACPTEAPVPVTVPPCDSCNAPAPPPAAPVTPVAPVETPCPTTGTVAPPAETYPAVGGNATTPTYEGAASGLRSSFCFVAGLAALVAFAL